MISNLDELLLGHVCASNSFPLPVKFALALISISEKEIYISPKTPKRREGQLFHTPSRAIFILHSSSIGQSGRCIYPSKLPLEK